MWTTKRMADSVDMFIIVVLECSTPNICEKVSYNHHDKIPGRRNLFPEYLPTSQNYHLLSSRAIGLIIRPRTFAEAESQLDVIIFP